MSRFYSPKGIKIIDLTPVNPQRPSVYSIYQFLDKIRPHVALYAGPYGVEGLFHFVMAYETGMLHAGMKAIETPRFSEFANWIQEKYGFSSSSRGWGNMILAVVLGHRPSTVCWESYKDELTADAYPRSIELFFRLLDEYIKGVDRA